MKIADTNPDRPIEEILKDIEDQAQYGTRTTVGPIVLGPMAALLVRLSRDAKETAREAAATADKTLVFTKYLFWATIILLVVTVLLFGLELMKFYESGDRNPETNKTQHQGSVDINKLPAPTTEQPKGGPNGMDLLK